MKKFVASLVTTLALVAPLVAYAFPFGGSIGQIVFCYNDAIYTSVGPPNGGPYIWTPSTRTYQFGPPSHTGQWLLGLAAPPYYCLVSIQPIIVWSGILMTMEGSSGPAAPGFAGGGGFGSGPTTFPSPMPSPTPPPSPPSSGGSGHLVVNELYYAVTESQGGIPDGEWVEIYNPLNTSIDLSNWKIVSATMSQTIATGTTLSAKSYFVLAGSSNVRTMWNIPEAVQVLTTTSPSFGFIVAGDHVYLQNAAGVRVDAVSYGTDTGAFSPAVPATQTGNSLVRKNLTTDTDSASDWQDSSSPAAGR